VVNFHADFHAKLLLLWFIKTCLKKCCNVLCIKCLLLGQSCKRAEILTKLTKSNLYYAEAWIEFAVPISAYEARALTVRLSRRSVPIHHNKFSFAPVLPSNKFGVCVIKVVGKQISRGEGATKKKDRKIALLILFQGGGGREKIPKRAKKNNQKKEFYVPGMKIQGGPPCSLLPTPMCVMCIFK